MHKEIRLAQSIYEANGIICNKLLQESESTEYAAATFQLNHKTIIFRAAKITPTKTGQFVTVWKRNQQGVTAPYEDADAFDFFIVCTREEERIGHFIFPKSVLLDQKIISGTNSAGKRGMRVYPPWDQAASKQAEKTQSWQLDYFIDFSIGELTHAKLLHTLLGFL